MKLQGVPKKGGLFWFIAQVPLIPYTCCFRLHKIKVIPVILSIVPDSITLAYVAFLRHRDGLKSCSILKSGITLYCSIT